MYRAAIIGLGKIAWRYDGLPDFSDKASKTHAKAYLLNQEVELVAGASINEKDRTDFYRVYNTQIFTGYEEMLDKIKPDIVSICTPLESHFEQLRTCLSREIKMVWLEKPPLLSAQQIESILAYQRKYNNKTRIMVGYQRRYSRTFMNLKKMMGQGFLGELKNIQVTYSRGIIENGSHYLDLVSYLLGDPSVMKLDSFTNDNQEGNPSFRLLPPAGPPVFFTGMNLPYHCLDLMVTGTRGRASVLHGGADTRWEEMREQELYPGYYYLKEIPKCPFGAGGLEDAMNNSLADIINAFEKNRRPLSDLPSSRVTLSILDEIQHLSSLG